MNELLTLSATQLAQMIQAKTVSSKEVVQTHIDHIEQVNGILNAVVAKRFDQAVAEADTADRQLARRSKKNSRPPFLGVPFTVKESFAVSGMPNTAGLVSRKGKACASDAEAVARLRAAGGIVLGVTNTSELCMWVESNNRVYGLSKNPYNPFRIVGGSSGGEGAIVGAGGSPFGLASDIAGSIRLPAFFNGVFGHKPTGGRVPATGHFPVPTDRARRYATMGPITRRAEDLMPLLAILAGPDGKDHQCRRMALKSTAGIRMSDLTLIDLPLTSCFRIQKELTAAQERCMAAIAEAGASIRHHVTKTLRHAFHIWTAMMDAAEEKTFASLMGDGHRFNPFVHLMQWPFRRTPHTLPAIGLAIYEKIVTPAKKFVEMGHALRQELIDCLGRTGILILPSFTSTAPIHFSPMLRPFDWALTGIFNVLEFPATQVPIGFGANGLPLGVQVVAIPGNDHLTIAVAMELERIFGGWVPPEVPVTAFSATPLRFAKEVFQEGQRLFSQAVMMR